jgi:ABC-2 type transport system ATP-binding protein
MSVINISHLSKKFGSFTAVDDTNLSVKQGQIFALIGPNGAGKTTLIKLMVGLINPSDGKIIINGFDFSLSPLSYKQNIGYVPDEPVGYDYLSGMEFLTFTARLRGLSGRKMDRRINELVSLFPISDIIFRPMGEYSRGNKQKVGFLSAILTTPPVLIIDEPVVGLDPPSIRIFGKILTDYAESGNTVFFVTHILEFARDYATDAAVMKDGKIIKEINIIKSTNLDSLL